MSEVEENLFAVEEKSSTVELIFSDREQKRFEGGEKRPIDGENFFEDGENFSIFEEKRLAVEEKRPGGGNVLFNFCLRLAWFYATMGRLLLAAPPARAAKVAVQRLKPLIETLPSRRSLLSHLERLQA